MSEIVCTMNIPLKRIKTSTQLLSQDMKRQKTGTSEIDFSHTESVLDTKIALIKAFPEQASEALDSLINVFARSRNSSLEEHYRTLKHHLSENENETKCHKELASDRIFQRSLYMSLDKQGYIKEDNPTQSVTPVQREMAHLAGAALRSYTSAPETLSPPEWKKTVENKRAAETQQIRS